MLEIEFDLVCSICGHSLETERESGKYYRPSFCVKPCPCIMNALNDIAVVGLTSIDAGEAAACVTDELFMFLKTLKAG